MVQEVKSGFCTLCRSRCGTLNRVENDALIAVEPDPSHPNGAAMCRKGKAAPELVHHPDRLTTPLRRTAPKGAADPGWQRISWDEALTEIAHRLGDIRRESGAHAVAFGVTTPSGTPLSDSIDWIERFVRVFGSPNTVYATEICNWHKDFAHAFTFGCGMPTADYAHADVIILWGHNPTSTWLSQANAIARGRARGARLLVVDPRKTPLAADADAWLPVRPGADAALALGLARRLIDQNRYDAKFLRRWTNGPLLVRGDNGHFLRARDIAHGDVGLAEECLELVAAVEQRDLRGRPRRANPCRDLEAQRLQDQRRRRGQDVERQHRCDGLVLRRHAERRRPRPHCPPIRSNEYGTSFL